MGIQYTSKNNIKFTGLDAFKHVLNKNKGLKGVCKACCSVFIGCSVKQVDVDLYISNKNSKTLRHNTKKIRGMKAFKHTFEKVKGLKGFGEAIISFFVGYSVKLAPATKQIPNSNGELYSANTDTKQEQDTSTAIMPTTDQVSNNKSPSLDGNNQDNSLDMKEALASLAKNNADNNHPAMQDGTQTNLNSPLQAPRKTSGSDLSASIKVQQERDALINEDIKNIFDSPITKFPEKILKTLGLPKDAFENDCQKAIEWLDSSSFKKIENNETLEERILFVKHLIVSVTKNGTADSFRNLCAIIGSCSPSARWLAYDFEPLIQAFKINHMKLLDTDPKTVMDGKNVIGFELYKSMNQFMAKLNGHLIKKNAREQAKEQTKEPLKTGGPELISSDKDEVDASRKWIIAQLEDDKVVDGDMLVNISHGGGMHYLNKFLKKKVEGYRLEVGKVKGLQVHTSEGMKSREVDSYAPHALEFLDMPARFTAQIPAKFLMAADNTYEAAITSNEIDELINTSITTLDKI